MGTSWALSGAGRDRSRRREPSACDRGCATGGPLGDQRGADAAAGRGGRRRPGHRCRSRSATAAPQGRSRSPLPLSWPGGGPSAVGHGGRSLSLVGFGGRLRPAGRFGRGRRRGGRRSPSPSPWPSPSRSASAVAVAVAVGGRRSASSSRSASASDRAMRSGSGAASGSVRGGRRRCGPGSARRRLRVCRSRRDRPGRRLGRRRRSGRPGTPSWSATRLGWPTRPAPIVGPSVGPLDGVSEAGAGRSARSGPGTPTGRRRRSVTLLRTRRLVGRLRHRRDRARPTPGRD